MARYWFEDSYRAYRLVAVEAESEEEAEEKRDSGEWVHEEEATDDFDGWGETTYDAWQTEYGGLGTCTFTEGGHD